MPDLIISLTVTQIDRLRAALDITTRAELVTIIKQQLRSIVLNAEIQKEHGQGISQAKNTLRNEGWNV